MSYVRTASIAAALFAVIAQAQAGLQPLQFDRAAKHHAVVVSNQKYGAPLQPLANPANDADLIAKSLAARGYSVMRASDLTAEKLRRLLAELQNSVNDADTLLFYYAGHGALIDQLDYMLPVDLTVDAKQQDANRVIAAASVPLCEILGAVAGRAKHSAVFYDASRLVPQATAGAASAATPAGPTSLCNALPQLPDIVAFSGEAGGEVLDQSPDDPKHGPYALAIAEQVAAGVGDIDELLLRIRRQVVTEGRSAGRTQLPVWYRSPDLDVFSLPGTGEIREYR